MFNAVEDIFENYNKTLNDLNINHPIKGPIQYHITGEGGGDWYLEISGVDISAHIGIVESPFSIVECEAEAYLDLKNGKVTHEEILKSNKMKLVKGIRNVILLSLHMIK